MNKQEDMAARALGNDGAELPQSQPESDARTASAAYHYVTANAPAGYWSWQLFRTATGERVAHGLCCLTRAAAQGEARRTKAFFLQADGQCFEAVQ